MQIRPTPISGLAIVQTTPIVDERGSFSRLFSSDKLQSVIGARQITQINFSCTEFVGTVRGLHYQVSPYAEMKLVRCLKGRIWDIAVDLRYDSPTFLKWYAEELSPKNNLMLVIPEGFAHGFQVLEPNSELLYLHTANYAPQGEGGLRYDDPRLGISWPVTPKNLSKRDNAHPLISGNFSGLVI